MAYSGSFTPRPMYTDAAYPNFVNNATSANQQISAAAIPAFYRQNQNQNQSQYQHPTQQNNHQAHHPLPQPLDQLPQLPQLSQLPHHHHSNPQLSHAAWQVQQQQQQQQLLQQNQNQKPQSHPRPQSQSQPQPQQQQQFYSNAYPHPTPPPPSSSSPSPQSTVSLIQPQGAGNQAHVPNQFQDYGNGRPTSMPPPSNFSDATLARRAYLHPQRPLDRWPAGTNEEQRQMQEQYSQHGRPNLYFNPQLQQRQPMISIPSPAPVSTFSPPPQHPSQHPSTPPSTSAQPQQHMASLGSAFELSKPSSTPVPSSIEAQRVTILLELNSILLQEVVNLQNAGKAELPQPQQQSPPHEQDTGTPIPGQKATTPDEKMTTTPGASQKLQGSGKQPAKEFIEYMRRLQANLAYLASMAEHNSKHHSKPQNAIPPFPAIMDPPAVSEPDDGKEGLRDMYMKMRELWPEYKAKA